MNGDLTAGGTVSLVAVGQITTSPNPTITQASGALTASNLVVRTQSPLAGVGTPAITLTGAGNAVTGNVTLTLLDNAGTGLSAGNIAFTNSTGFTVAGQAGGGVSGLETGIGTLGTATLVSGGKIAATGIVTAGTLTGGSVGGVTLNGGNLVTTFGGFADAGAGSTGISLNNAQAFSTASTISSATGPVTLTTTAGDLTLGGNLTATRNTVTLNSAGVILQSSGAVTAATLTGGSVGGATLNGSNLVNTFGGFSDTGNGSAGISFTNAQTLGTTGTISSASGPVTLTTTAGGLNLGGDLTTSANTVTLNSAGAITQSSGIITAATLTGGSVGDATLAQANVINTFGPWMTISGSLTFADSVSFTTAGVVSADADVVLRSTAADTQITVGAAASDSVSGLNVTLEADNLALTGTVNAGSNGTATIIPFSAGRPIAVGDQISKGVLGLPAALLDQISANTLIIGNTASGMLTVSSAVAPAAVTNLTLVSGSSIALNAGVTIPTGGTLTLTASGSISQTAGAITAGTLTGSSVGGASLDQGNAVATFGAFSDTGGGSSGVTFVNAQALSTTGTISSSTGPIALTTTSGDLILGGNLTVTNNTVSLTSAGAITQQSGAIDPVSLLVQSVGSASFTGANIVDTLAAAITGSGSSLTFNNTATNLAVGTVGAVSGIATSNGAVTLSTTTSGNLTLQSGDCRGYRSCLADLGGDHHAAGRDDLRGSADRQLRRRRQFRAGQPYRRLLRLHQYRGRQLSLRMRRRWRPGR